MSIFSISSLFRLHADSELLAFAHRGISELYPENTLLAYSRSASHGTNLIELDVQLTGDGELVCIHDDTVDRTTDGTGAVSSYSYMELQKLDAGYRFCNANKEFLYRGKGLTIPRLRDVLLALPDCYFSIELKDSSLLASQKLVLQLTELNVIDRVMVNLIGMKSSSGRRLRCLEPRISTGHTTTEFIWFYALSLIGLSRFFRPKGIAFEIPLKKLGFSLVTKRTISAAHRLGISVIVWTINDLAQARRIHALGVDAIMSDSPELIGCLREHIK